VRIGIFDPYLDSLSGGEKYMLSIASCLSKEHEVYIFWDQEKEAEIKREAKRKLDINLSSVKFYRNLFNESVSLTARFFETKDFDVIIYLSDGSIPLLWSKTFVHFQFPIEWVDGKSLKTKFKLSFVKKIFCNSHFTKSFIDRKLGVKSEVLYPPVDLHVIKNIKKENIILHVGRFDVDVHESNYKKQDIMIDVFKKMIDEGLKNWELRLILGIKEKDKKKLRKLQEMSLGYPIKLIVNVSNEELWENYSKAKIYWHATGFGEDLEKYPEKAEHFGITTVEAMGAGCVPIVFNAGGQREIVEDGKNGYLFNNLEDFSFKTLALINNQNLLQQMSRSSIERSKMFVGKRFCNELKEIIK
jgi:glycosyltransferase involved in cell wall biosynthesis